MKKYQFKICTGCNYFCNKNESTEFCPYCGEKLIDKCPSCEDTITTPYGNYCTKCGHLYPGRSATKKA